MSLGNIFKALAPIAAGAAFGPGGTLLAGSAGTAGSAVAAGALTGAGIAALSGDDPLMGAISGGMGGYGGSGIGEAMRGTAASAVTPTSSTLPSQFQNLSGKGFDYGAATSSYGGAGIAPGNMNPTTLTSGFKASLDKPGQFLSNLGGGSMGKGAAKLGAVGLPAIGQAMVPEYNANPSDDPMSKYDPNRRLNVGMTTGIQNALKRDSGLRLNQFAQGGFLGREPLYNLPSSVTPLTEEELDYLQTEEELEAENQEFLKEQRKKNYEIYSQRTEREKDELRQLAEQKFARRIAAMGGHENYDAGLIASPTLPPAILTPPGLVASPMLPPAISTPDFEERARGYRSVETTGLPRYDDKYEAMAQGGYLETGMGDGVSDDIPSSIDGEQPAALSENEFVIPADVVSGLGNGSSDAGAEQLYAMMDRVRKARTGTEKMGKEINAERLMPA